MFLWNLICILLWPLFWIISQLFSWLPRLFPPPSNVFNEDEYRRANNFKNLFTPDSNEDYDWVSEYAQFTYEQYEAFDEVLDKKAKSIMRLLGGRSGPLSLGAIVNLSKIGFETRIGIGTGLVFALLSVAAAAWVRVPRVAFLPPTIVWALEYVEAYKKESRDIFLAQWHLACEGMRLTIAVKSWGV